MKIENIVIKEEDGKIYADLTLPLAQVFMRKPVPKMVLETAHVVEILKERGIEVGKCIKDATVKNYRQLQYSRQGTWIFEKKVLDKSPEPVILKEEKSVQPKPTRKKRTRSSIKKVSTEE